MEQKLNALFVSHGAGPLPLLGDAQHSEMVSCLQKVASSIKKPSAIIIVSAHWEEFIPTISANANPSLIYDYSGFPEEAYGIQYLCSGSPELARDIYQAFQNLGIKSNLNYKRGLDHGAFVPLKIMYPDADIPCVQVSLVHSLDTVEHLKIGRALQSLKDRGILIIGSGFSFHNMHAFFSKETEQSKHQHNSFEDWLVETCSSNSLSEDERFERLAQWEDAPYARYCHPREEHLLPLHICYGASGKECSKVFELQTINKRNSMYLWD